MGFYPVCPGTDEYVIGSPLFKKVTVNLPNDKKLIINSSNNSKTNRYIDSIEANGKSYAKNYFSHGDLTKGMSIIFKMSDVVNKKRGINKEDFPYSFSNELKK